MNYTSCKITRHPVYEALIADVAGLYQVFERYDRIRAPKIHRCRKKNHRKGGRPENYLQDEQNPEETRKS